MDNQTYHLRVGIVLLNLTGLLALLLPACAHQLGTESALPSGITTSGPTNTPVSATYTTAPASPEAMTATAVLPIEKTCPVIESELRSDILSPGMIVFLESEGFLLESKDYLYTISSQDFEPHPFLKDLTSGVFSTLLVSSDSRWLAFRHEKMDGQKVLGPDLILTSSDDQKRITIPWNEEEWGYIEGWLADNQNIVIVPKYPQDTIYRDEVILFNPFTEQQENFFPSFSYPENSYILDSIGQTVFYDPTLKHVAYQEDDDTLVLWDLEEQREVWRFVEPLILDVDEPIWSPDGEFIVLVDSLSDKKHAIAFNADDSFQTILINKDGESVWQDIYPFYKDWVSSTNFTWSPDGRYLAFTRWNHEKSTSQVFLLDTTDLAVLDYCIQNFSSPLVWSPDSQQFIVQIIDPNISEDEDAYQNLVVDVTQNRVFELEEISLRPIAWLRTEP